MGDDVKMDKEALNAIIEGMKQVASMEPKISNIVKDIEELDTAVYEMKGLFADVRERLVVIEVRLGTLVEDKKTKDKEKKELITVESNKEIARMNTKAMIMTALIAAITTILTQAASAGLL